MYRAHSPSVKVTKKKMKLCGSKKGLETGESVKVKVRGVESKEALNCKDLIGAKLIK